MYKAAKTIDDLLNIKKDIKSIAVDTETTGLNTQRDKLVGIALSWQEGQGLYIPLGHHFKCNLPIDEVRKILNPILKEKIIVMHEAKFDIHFLLRYGFTIDFPIIDTKLLYWVLFNHDKLRLGLKDLVKQHYNFVMPTFKATRGKKQTFAHLTAEEAYHYACCDADYTLRLANKQDRWLNGDNQYARILSNIDLPTLPILVNTERNGFMVDIEKLKKLDVEFADKLDYLNHRILCAVEELTGIKKINISSPQQIGHLFFEKLGIRSTVSTPTGQPSTSADVLEKLQHPIADAILEYRKLDKLRNTYTQGIQKSLEDAQGSVISNRVYPTFKQSNTTSGRLACADPNLQNIPSRVEYGTEIRKCFIAPKNSTLISVDYSQIELRVLAHYTKEPALMSAFINNEDVHTKTAAKIYRIAEAQVTKAQRAFAKTVNFGIAFGMTAQGLFESAQGLITLEQAKQFHREYLRAYPQIAEFIDSTVPKARSKKALFTLCGRIRHFPELRTNSDKRSAVNFRVQATAADIMKLGSIRVYATLIYHEFQTKIVNLVHDEIVLECPNSEVNDIIPLVQHAMETAYPLDVPIPVEIETGSNWGDLKELDLTSFCISDYHRDCVETAASQLINLSLIETPDLV